MRTSSGVLVFVFGADRPHGERLAVPRHHLGQLLRIGADREMCGAGHRTGIDAHARVERDHAARIGQ
jgi:hypothetical protein